MKATTSTAVSLALLRGATPGQKVEFDIVQAGPGRFVITRIAPAAGKAAKAGK